MTQQYADYISHQIEEGGMKRVASGDGLETFKKKPSETTPPWRRTTRTATGRLKTQTGLDPVKQSELQGKHSDREDQDIDNDGTVGKSDRYLHGRRKKVSKEMQKKSNRASAVSAIIKNITTSYDPELDEEDVDESMSVHLKPHPNGTHYVVHKVGSKLKAHGGLKVGEKITDTAVDDLGDSGVKVKHMGEGISVRARPRKDPFAQKATPEKEKSKDPFAQKAQPDTSQFKQKAQPDTSQFKQKKLPTDDRFKQKTEGADPHADPSKGKHKSKPVKTHDQGEDDEDVNTWGMDPAVHPKQFRKAWPSTYDRAGTSKPKRKRASQPRESDFVIKPGGRGSDQAGKEEMGQQGSTKTKATKPKPSVPKDMYTHYDPSEEIEMAEKTSADKYAAFIGNQIRNQGPANQRHYEWHYWKHSPASPIEESSVESHGIHQDVVSHMEQDGKDPNNSGDYTAYSDHHHKKRGFTHKQYGGYGSFSYHKGAGAGEAIKDNPSVARSDPT